MKTCQRIKRTTKEINEAHRDLDYVKYIFFLDMKYGEAKKWPDYKLGLLRGQLSALEWVLGMRCDLKDD